MCVVCTYEEQCDGHCKQEFARWCEQRLVVYLLPHGQVIECATVELERRTFHQVEHDVEPYDVGHIGQRPGPLRGDARQYIVEHLQ